MACWASISGRGLAGSGSQTLCPDSTAAFPDIVPASTVLAYLGRVSSGLEWVAKQQPCPEAPPTASGATVSVAAGSAWLGLLILCLGPRTARPGGGEGKAGKGWGRLSHVATGTHKENT